MTSFRLTAVALLVLPSIARAADLPVTYTVQEKQLKTALAGTSLTFGLFQDPACTGSPAYSTAILIENVTLITRLKQLTPKGDTKLPNTDALMVTLPGVATPGNLYLKVTGTGVVPVGGGCQAQAAQVVAPNCLDGIQNQGETDVDCGGANSCPRCATGQTCAANGDCQSASCQSGTCQLPGCMNGVQDGTETDVDCGGMNACPRCAQGQTCANGGDCQSGLCSAGTCQAAPTCTDMLQNGLETDVDCGGGMCPACAVGKMCQHAMDCLSGSCMGGTCQPSCTDGMQDGTETDLDCGGPNACPRCPAGKACLSNSDCVSNSCMSGACQ